MPEAFKKQEVRKDPPPHVYQAPPVPAPAPDPDEHTGHFTAVPAY